MSLRRLTSISVVVLAMIGLLAFSTKNVSAQGNNNGGIQPAGVEVGADGVLRTKLTLDPSGQLTRQRMNQAKSSLNEDVMKKSELRKISLNRLEKAVAERYANGETETSEMKNLAGLTEIKYVFFYPETNDIVIAGPAEGYFEAAGGKMIGMESFKPVIELEDLVVALRAFRPGAQENSVIGCSIDPTAEGLKRMQEFLAQARVGFTPAKTQFIAEGLRQNLGMQTVSVFGVSPKTHFAHVMVEADYRMKLIGIGLESPVASITSYVEKANPSAVAKNALSRWYFTPDYECIVQAEDANAIELVGGRIKLIGEEERVSANGERVSDKETKNAASKAFCESMTKNYGELAKASSVFGQLRNVVDLSIVAAYMQAEDLYGKAGWDMEFFGNEDSFPVERYEAARQVETAVNAIWKGNKLMTPIGGGVQVEPWHALNKNNIKSDSNGEIARASEQNAPKLEGNQWWWD